MKNYTGEIINYLKRNLKKGYTKESLRHALLSQGHSRREIDNAIQRAEEELANSAPILKTRPEIKREIIHDAHDSENQIIHKKPEKKSLWKRLFD